MIAALLVFLLLFGVAHAQTQNTVQQVGTITPGHMARWNGPGLVSDAGGAAGSPTAGQRYLTELGITNFGTPFCINDALTSNPEGYHQLCLGANALGGGLLSYQAVGSGAVPLHFNCNINGVSIPDCLLGGGGGAGTVLPGTGPALAQYQFGSSRVVGPISASSAFANPQGGPLDLATNGVLNSKLAQMPPNTVKGNFTASTANAADNALPSCSGSNQALTYTLGTGFGCVTISAGGGSITSLSAGSGITLSPNPIVSTGTVSTSGITQQITVASACTGASCTPVTSCQTYTAGVLTAFASGACSGGAGHPLTGGGVGLTGGGGSLTGG